MYKRQIPKNLVPHVNVLTPARAKRILCKHNRTLVVLKYLNLKRLHTRPEELKHSVHKQSLLHTITHRRYSASEVDCETHFCVLEIQTTSMAATKTNAPETDLRSVDLLVGIYVHQRAYIYRTVLLELQS